MEGVPCTYRRVWVHIYTCKGYYDIALHWCYTNQRGKHLMEREELANLYVNRPHRLPGVSHGVLKFKSRLNAWGRLNWQAM